MTHARRLLSLLCLAVLLTVVPVQHARSQPEAAPSTSSTVSEADYYRLSSLPIPEGITLEVGGMTVLPDGRLAVSTRRGDVWLIENPYMADGSLPYFKRFAQGLHEPLGLAYTDGVFYANQRGELTRLVDTDDDERADRYEAVMTWPLEGNYHEYSYGPMVLPNGDLFVTLNLAWIGYGASLSKWSGWALRVSPEGDVTPIATGLRSPAGFGMNAEGDIFYAENQGDWVGSGRVSHVEEGDFLGNPAGLRWTDEPGSPLALKPEDVPDTGQPMHVVKEEVPELKLPALWFPHGLMGISTSDILVDSTGGGFGPFEDQLFVGDQGHSTVMRAFLEQIDGVYQGAVFPFRKGLSSGVLRLSWGHDGSMFVGMTNRGWASTGRAPYGIDRLQWTGKMPLEIKEMRAKPDGFELEFTRPVDRTMAADPSTYQVTGFTYRYHSTYGSPAVEQQPCAVRTVHVSDDGTTVRLAVDGLREGFVHELAIDSLQSASGIPLLHDVAYYTLNRIPEGAPLSAGETARPVDSEERTNARTEEPDADAAQFRHQTSMPEAWDGVDATVTIGTEPGLQYDRTSFQVPAGATVRLVFNNDDDMLHNLLIVRDGTVEQVAQAALALGLSGQEQGYVPASDDVLHYTSLLQPETSQSIYFRAPETPGEYPYVCTFPGHWATMQGVMEVVAP